MRKIMLLKMLAASIFMSSCNDDDNTVNPVVTVNPKDYKVQFWGFSSSEVQYPLTVTYYKDNQNGIIGTENVSSQTNTDVIESRTITSYDKLGFKLTVGNSGQATVNTVIITDVQSNEVVFESYELDVDSGQTFMYDLSDNTYTVQ